MSGVKLVVADHQFLPIGHTKFIENAGQVMANCIVANEQFAGDFFVGQPVLH